MELILHVIKLDEQYEKAGTVPGGLQAELSSLISSSYNADEYTPLTTDTEIDDEKVSNMLYGLWNILDDIDAGGKPLSYMVDTDKGDAVAAIGAWIAVLEVYGCVGKAQNASD